MKSTVEDIRTRFDHDVARFSNLETGQSATIDAPLVMDLIAQAAAATNPDARHLLDVGCGAGNYALKLLQVLPNLDVDLLDLSRPMLDRAIQRVKAIASGQVVAIQGDIREVPLALGCYDVIVAAATLHHLREDAEWARVFAKLYQALKPGGSLWISDMVVHSGVSVEKVMWHRYGAYLTALKDEAYRLLKYGKSVLFAIGIFKPCMPIICWRSRSSPVT